MSSKVLLFSDLHCHPHKKSWDRLRHCLEVLEWAFQVALERQITEIVFCGDLFHDRQKIDILVYQRVFEVMHKHLMSGKLNFHCLLGNHDLWHNDKWDVSSCAPLEALPGFHLIGEVCTRPICGKPWDFLPYTHNPVDCLDLLTGARSERVLCAHVAVHGAQMNTMHNILSDVWVEHDGDMVLVTPELFKDWKYVFLGHYHGEQKLADNMEYVGSPLQLSFGEAFQFKHLIIYDVDTGEKEYVRNTFSPQHFIIPAKDVDKYELNKNYIRLLVENLGATDVVDMRADILKNNKVGSLEIKPVEREERTHIIENAKAILYKEGEMLERYIDEVGTDGLERERLLEIGKLICSPLTDEELESIS